MRGTAGLCLIRITDNLKMRRADLQPNVALALRERDSGQKAQQESDSAAHREVYTENLEPEDTKRRR